MQKKTTYCLNGKLPNACIYIMVRNVDSEKICVKNSECERGKMVSSFVFA